MTLTALQLPLPGGSTVTDQQAQAALSVVEGYCGWSLESGTVTGTFDGDGSTVLVLPSLNVTAVTSLAFNGTDPWGNAWPTLVAGVDWDWRANGVLTRLNGAAWPNSGQIVTVTYTSGYASLPGVVLAVCASVAQRLAADSSVQQHLENVGGIQSNTTFGQSVTAGAGLTAVEMVALNRYKIESMA